MPESASDGRRPSLTGSLAIALGVLTIVTAAAILWGAEPTSLELALRSDGLDRTILLRVRLPRVVLAALCGGGLGVVGGAFQALTRNPLAEPFVLGVSGGAALGATGVMALGLEVATMLGVTLVPLAALVGGLGATAIVLAVGARAPRGPGGASILLAGVMVNSIAAALITFAKVMVPPSRAQNLLRWLVGFIELRTNAELVAVSLYVAAGCALLLRDSGRMNLLALGDESAQSLGIDVRALERRVLLASSCIVGAIVSLTGLIGFVGLVVPHVVRRWVGPDHRRLLPVAFVGGATMLVGCDLVARIASRLFGELLPVGAVTALVGGPVFLVMLARRSPTAEG